MKKIIMIAALAIAATLCANRANAQIASARTNAEAISASVDAPGYLVRSYERVYLNGKKLSLDEIQQEMSPENFKKYKSGRSLYKAFFPVSVVGAIGAWGGFALNCIWLAEGNDNQKLSNIAWGSAGIGLALVAIATPFEMAGLVKMDKAVDGENASRQPVFSFGPTGNGIGFQLKF